ncbi:hypothetical protein BH11PLA2_BH11PLA2_02350 [soil metagenome]
MKPEPYIPLRVTDLIDVLLTEAGTPQHAPPSQHDAECFRELAGIVGDRITASHRAIRNLLKDVYAPFDPDTETIHLRAFTDEDRHVKLQRLFGSFTVLLERGGFHRMTRAEIEEAIIGASYWGIEMDVCWEVFDRVEIFVRGEGIGWRTRRPWWLFFRSEDVQVPTYRRVVLILKQQPHKRLGRDPDTQSVFLKIFKDIPTMDVEMLLPGTQVRMRRADRGKLGGSALGSLAYIAWKLLTSISIPQLLSGSLLALASPLFLIIGYGYKTFYSFKVSRRTYMLQLHQSLYYQGLDSNAGVLFRLFDEAAEQDIRQTLLAYYFLWRFAPAQGWDAETLDKAVEGDLAQRVGGAVEVDTCEALARLQRLELIKQHGNLYTTLPIHLALIAVRDASETLADAPSAWQKTLL